MNALARPDVGNYLNAHFASAFQKVGTFRLAGTDKQGGNVASYFCTPDGRVLHVLAGPVDGATMLREARWVVETWKLAQLEKHDASPARLRGFFRKVHFERLRLEHGIDPKALPMPVYDATPQTAARTLDWPRKRGLNNEGRIHFLLASYPLVRIEQVYTAIFERVLNEKLSTLPLVQKG